MAELALAAFAGLGATGATAGTAAAAAGAGLFGSTAMSVLSGAATVGSVLMGFSSAAAEESGGRAALAEAQTQAAVARLEGEQSVTESAARAVELQKDHLRKAAAARVAFAGSGLDISSGQLGAIEGSLERERDYGLSIEAGNQATARSRAELTAGRYELAGVNSVAAAGSRATAKRLGGIVEGARGLLSFAKRG